MKRVVILGDIHVGNRLSVAPPEFTMLDGSRYVANKPQQALYKAWCEVVNDWKRPDALIINGEPIDGQSPKDRGVEAWTTNYLEQIRAAVQLVKMFDAKKIYVTRGSNYHVSHDGVSVEEIFGEQVHAEESDEGYARRELFLDVDGVVFNAAHHIAGSSSGWNYRSTPIAKEMMLGQLNASHKRDFNVMIRSHNHYYWVVESTSKLGMNTPAWKLQDWFSMKRGTMGTIPDIGAVRFLVENKRHSHEVKIMKMPEWIPTLVKL